MGEMEIPEYLIIVPSLSGSMFPPEFKDCLFIYRLQNEGELKEILSIYKKVVSYHRHPPTLNYLKKFREDITQATESEFKADRPGTYNFLVVSLARRQHKEKQQPDVEISGFQDLAVLHVESYGIGECPKHPMGWYYGRV